MRLLLILGLAGLGLVLTGCRHSKPAGNSMADYESTKARKGRAASSKAAPSAKAQPKITPLDELAGKVADVNGSLRFVVIEFPLGTLPKLDQRMAVYRGGQRVAEVKIDKWTNGVNVVADITAGEAKIGDEVRNN